MAGEGDDEVSASPVPEAARRPHVAQCAAVLALAAVFIVTGLVQADRDSLAVDEAVDLTAGLVAVEHRDLRMNPEHGLLHHVLPGVLPVLVADPVVPRTEAFHAGDWFDYTEDLVVANAEAGTLQRTVFWFRVVPLLAGALTGVLIYLLARRLFGRVGGLVSAALWFTTPYVVGLSHLSSLDVSFTCALVGLTLALVRLLDEASVRRVAVVGLALGATLLVRHSGLAVVPAVVVVTVLALRRQGARRAVRGVAVVAVVSIAVVWVGYRLVDIDGVEGQPRERFEQVIAVARGEGPVQEVAVSAPLPLEWRAGLAYLFVTAEDRPAYLLGEHWQGSRPGFFPLTASVKVPLSATAVVFIGLGAWVHLERRTRRRAALSLGLVGPSVAGFLLLQPLNLGLRLAVPVLALVFVAAGAIGSIARRRPVRAVLGVALVLQVVAFAIAHPHSLAWTPPPFTDGYRYVSDSSIDLGQANGAVRARHRTAPLVAASLISPRGGEGVAELPQVHQLAPAELVGDVAVSATTLTTMRWEELAWLRAYCPVEILADSILIYRFDRPPDTRPGPSTPAAPCDGEVSLRPR